MTPQAQFVLLAWLPLTFFLFLRFPPRTAVIMSFLGGVLFLPQRAGFKLPLIPDYQGITATCYGILLAIVFLDAKRLSNFKPGWLDLPMVIWCICPLLSSLSNGLGFYDGLNALLGSTAVWGLPYFLGRLYLNNLAGLRELALRIIQAGLLYVPLCLYEIRMSPQLHRIVYGYYAHPSGIAQTRRLGGWRPSVFMVHGLHVAMFMLTATLVVFWLWKAGVPQKIWNLPVSWLVATLALTFVLLKSSGSYLYLLIGIGILFSAKWLRTSVPLLLLVASICFYLYLGATGSFNGDGIVNWAAQINTERAQSLEFRFNNEELLREKAQERPIFGWGGWGRSRIYQENFQGDIENVSVTDSRWIIAFGENGLVGLISLTGAILLPVVFFCRRYPARTWFHPQIAPAAVLGLCLTLFMLDSLLNTPEPAIFSLITGGISGLVIKEPTQIKSVNHLPRVVKHNLNRGI